MAGNSQDAIVEWTRPMLASDRQRHLVEVGIVLLEKLEPMLRSQDAGTRLRGCLVCCVRMAQLAVCEWHMFFCWGTLVGGTVRMAQFFLFGILGRSQCAQ